MGETSGVDACLSPEETARMELPVWFEIATFVGLTLLLIADLAIVARRNAPGGRRLGRRCVLWPGGRRLSEE